MNSTDKEKNNETSGFKNHFGFPYKTTLSFQLLLKDLEERAAKSEAPETPMVNEILKAVAGIPELAKPIEDLAVLKKFRKQVDLLMTSVVPVSLTKDTVTGIIIPFQPVTVYGTPKFKEMLVADDLGVWEFTKEKKDAAMIELIAFAGASILEKYYGVHLEHPDIFKGKTLDKVTRTSLLYKPDIFMGYIDVKVLKQPKPLSEIDLSPLNKNFFDAEFWLKNFPPDTFAFEGITVYRMVDITDREMISGLEYTLLQTGAVVSKKNIEEIKEKLRDYLKVPELSVGIAPMLNYRGKMSMCGEDNWFCFVPYDQHQLMKEHIYQSVYGKAVQDGIPVLIEDIEKLPTKTPIEVELLRQNIRCMIITPIFHGKELIGAIEVGTPHPNSLNFITLMKIRTILPLLNLAFRRASEDFDVRVQAAIKQNFTSIHPSVEWKFADAILAQAGKGEVTEAELPTIEFKDVTPVYGQVDIRGSSEHRNDAIRKDMIDYLNAAKNILKEAYKEYPFTLIDELIFRSEKFLQKLSQSLDSGDETEILDFMKAEVEPIFKTLSTRNISMKNSINDFIAAMDPAHELHQMRRKEFENSLTMINDLVVGMLDEEEARTQKMLPHYFEKYKTDGVEYNLYLGQSILEKGTFDPVYVRNFRLWQLVNMVNIARETHRILPYLSVPLETTQLILCYSNPFSIMFRMDEKRFDVAGAYNIRYEIVKKRIDKAHIKDTQERITQPHTIAIIYTQEKEVREYERYFEYLRAKGMIHQEVEHLDVEPLQGLQGLKALRIRVNYDSADEPKLNWDEEELFKNIKGELV